MKRIFIIVAVTLAASFTVFPQDQGTSAPQPANADQVRSSNEKLQQLYKFGAEAMEAKRYTEALKYFEEALVIRPQDPVFWMHKASALNDRGVSTYIAANLSSDDDPTKKALKEAARQDIRDAATSATKAFKLFSALPVPTQESARIQYETIRLATLRARARALRNLAMRIDYSYASDALAAMQEYIAAESDQNIKRQMQLAAAGMMLEVKRFDIAADEFQKALALDPESIEAMLGHSLALIDVGFFTSDQAILQQGLDQLQQFSDKAPDTHPLKGSAEEALNFLKHRKQAPETARDRSPDGANKDSVQRSPQDDNTEESMAHNLQLGMINGKALNLPQPPYPLIAKVARAEGEVVVRVTIDENGNVIAARPAVGHPLLQAVATAAARQTRFTPTTLSGKPVKASGTVTFNFKLYE